MLRALGKGFAVAGVATVAWLLFSVEGFVFSLWALDSTCETACETNLFAAFLISGLIGLEALVGTAVAGVLLAVRKLRAARITVYLLIAALALQHVWLLV
jgi:uncharacterized membrane protein